jgi:hypothetical protein
MNWAAPSLFSRERSSEPKQSDSSSAELRVPRLALAIELYAEVVFWKVKVGEVKSQIAKLVPALLDI